MQCNNFALKSMRGFFHDFESSDIEGSILWEVGATFNLGEQRDLQHDAMNAHALSRLESINAQAMPHCEGDGVHLRHVQVGAVRQRAL